MTDLRGYVEGMIGFDGGGTTVVANPTGTPTDNLESIQIDDVIYNIDGGGEEIVPTPSNTDRGKYLGVKSDANELEYREIREVPNPTGVELGNVLTRTVSGYMWSVPEKELPPYSTVENDMVLGVHNGELDWVEQSGGGSVEYSTNEHIVGTWIDGRSVYEKTIYAPNVSTTTMLDNSINLNNTDIMFMESMCFLFGGNYIEGLTMGYEVLMNNNGVIFDANNAITPFRSGISELYVTIRYIKKS